jgi:hypothetical protein
MAARFGQGDWDELLNMRPYGGALWWALPPLMLTACYYPATIPAAMAQLRIECPWLLSGLARRVPTD